MKRTLALDRKIFVAKLSAETITGSMFNIRMADSFKFRLKIGMKVHERDAHMESRVDIATSVIRFQDEL